MYAFGPMQCGKTDEWTLEGMRRTTDVVCTQKSTFSVVVFDENPPRSLIQVLRCHMMLCFWPSLLKEHVLEHNNIVRQQKLEPLYLPDNLIFCPLPEVCPVKEGQNQGQRVLDRWDY